ncbi:MAG: hypothetical protein NXI21_19310 [Alphaproteobacteria bacterium]|nr:hypothetical protein [Alphaproteobacteria bacterium]
MAYTTTYWPRTNAAPNTWGRARGEAIEMGKEPTEKKGFDPGGSYWPVFSPKFTVSGWLATHGIFSAGSIMSWDAVMRKTRYDAVLRDTLAKICQAYESGTLDKQKLLAHDAYKLRGKLLELTRARTSYASSGLEQFLKVKNPPFETIYNKVSGKLVESRSGFGKLSSSSQQSLVYREIISSAGRTNPMVNRFATGSIYYGLSCFLFIPSMVWHIYKAEREERVYETLKIGGALVGGHYTSTLGTNLLWAACAQTLKGKILPKQAIFLHVIFLHSTAFLGASGGSYAVDYIRDRWKGAGSEDEL